MNTVLKYGFLAILLAGVGWAGWALHGFEQGGKMAMPAAAGTESGHTAKPKPAPTLWACPMNHVANRKRPGKCPICGMTLVPQKPHATSQPSGSGRPTLTLTADERALAEIRTAPVERRFVNREVRMVGKIAYDETRVKTISAWLPSGRLDRLFVDYTGVPVSKGEHLVSIYSPELLTAQEELLEAKRTVERADPQRSAFLRKSDRRALDSAREKLRLWGLTDAQIADLERRGKAEDHMLVTSPVSGIVIHKGLNEGDYVKTGTPIYKIADIDHLWVLLDAYESDLPWLRYGQKILIESEAFPGERFEGLIAFIDWQVDEKTRTVEVRVNVENHGRKLKPGMFVHGIVQSRVAAGGAVLDPRLEGKWLCPMHPEVVENTAGSCPICGMDLVAASSLGEVVKEAGAPLVVPVTAVLVTGRRGVVYVEVPKSTQPTYEGREVVLGPRAGAFYIILAGLEEGERVVVNGNFKIDSALQIQAKPSMLSMPGDPGPLQGKPSSALRKALGPIYEAYLEAQTALAGDDLEDARKALAALAAHTAEVHPKEPAAHAAWHQLGETLHQTASKASKDLDLAATRRAFAEVSAAVIRLEKTFGHEGATAYTEIFCPMAFEMKGALWLQAAGKTANPYLGTAMPRCGEIREQHPGQGGKKR